MAQQNQPNSQNQQRNAGNVGSDKNTSRMNPSQTEDLKKNASQRANQTDQFDLNDDEDLDEDVDVGGETEEEESSNSKSDKKGSRSSKH